MTANALPTGLQQIPYKSPSIIGIDGATGVGKTILAIRLSKRLGLPVINLDKFFLNTSLGIYEITPLNKNKKTLIEG